ncbi:hypothetical protein Pcinc_042684, partial [Petrolisthes cinctipes]
CGAECDGSDLLYTLQQVSTLLFYTNFAINFLLYCVSGQNFRRALATLFLSAVRRLRPHNRRQPRRRNSAPHAQGDANRKLTGGVALNLKVWEELPANQPPLYPAPPSPPEPHPHAHTTTTTFNGHTRLTHLPDEKEDYF